MGTPGRFFLLLISINFSNSFNISPVPNIVLKNPDVSKQLRSSLFGCSIILRKNSVLIGAPKSNFTYPQIIEGGSVYSCPLEGLKNCSRFNVEKKSLYKYEKRDFQMLGLTMDGNDNVMDPFLVCAPKFSEHTENNAFLHGKCFWVSDSISSSNLPSIMELNWLKSRQQSYKDNNNPVFWHQYGQAGFSAHLTKDNVMILGAPGIKNWKGTAYMVAPTNNVQYSELGPPRFNEYTGYSVSSGNFNSTLDSDKLTYSVVSRRTSTLFGRVSIKLLSKKYDEAANGEFIGQQIGDYFGYSIIVDDFNNDKRDDIAISAPFYSKTGHYENGAVYIFVNKGRVNATTYDIRFRNLTAITSDFQGNGRFGLAMGKIGDINLDGYKDLAVAAPNEEDGVVYIYLGMVSGLFPKPYQKLQGSLPEISVPKNRAMFGFGLSKGVDIDENGYNDLAIGMPYSEEVVIFKTYPIVSLSSTINSSRDELSLDHKDFSIKFCTSFETKSQVKNVKISWNLELDKKYGRLSSDKTNSKNEIQEQVSINKEFCKEMIVYVTPSLKLLNKPLTISYRTELISPSNSSEFCDDCAAADPSENKMTTKQIFFKTGCKQQICNVDLVLTGSLSKFDEPYVIGSKNPISFEYELTNEGEPVFVPLINIQITPSSVQLSRKPLFCKVQQDSLKTVVCDIQTGSPLEKGQTNKLDFVLDTSNLSGNLLNITAVASSALKDNDTNLKNNVKEFLISLKKVSYVDVHGTTSESHQVSSEESLREIEYHWEIRNNGPSYIDLLTIDIEVPIKHRINQKDEIQMIDPKTIKIEGYYMDQFISNNLATLSRKTRAAVDDDVEDDDDDDDDDDDSKEFIDKIDDSRKIQIKCDESTECKKFSLTVENFIVGDESVQISMQAKIDLGQFDGHRKNDQDILIFQPQLTLQRGDKSNELHVISRTTDLIFFLETPFPLLMIIIAIIIGLLILLVIVYIMYRVGFFKRQKKTLIQEYKRQTLVMTPEQLQEYSKNIAQI